MSRCFPFPPPGYEKKTRTEDVDLLKKEKHREKKHKKEKKDKEKRESKERGEKDRSDEKRKEKKEKKEKNRDKKKDRNKDRDKSTSDERTLLGRTESHNGEKSVHKEHKNSDSSISYEKKYTGQSTGHTGDKVNQNCHLSEETKNSKLVQLLGWRANEEGSGSGTRNLSADKFSITQPKRDDGMVRLVAKGSNIHAEVKEKIKVRKTVEGKIVGQEIKDEARFSGKAMVQNHNGTGHNSVEVMSEQFNKNADRTETKEKIKEKEGSDKGRSKHKDRVRDKKGQTKDKERDKEKKKEIRVKEKVEQKSGDPDKIKLIDKDNLMDIHSIRTSEQLEGSSISAVTEGNFKKRKDFETNGVLHVNDNRSGKVLRPTSSSHPFMENGRTLEPCQTTILATSERQGVTNNHKLDNKERKINGILEAHTSASPLKALSITGQADQIAAARTKPPHPDFKYLSQVYSIPKMEERSDFSDQEWLYSSSSQTKKPKVESSEVEVMAPQVWAVALPIESADICALPYVIPY